MGGNKTPNQMEKSTTLASEIRSQMNVQETNLGQNPLVNPGTVEENFQIPSPSWNGVLGENRIASHGLNLEYIVPSIHDDLDVVELIEDDTQAETIKWMNSLIFYVLGREPALKYLEKYIQRVWNFVTKPDLFYHDEGYFVIRFVSKEDRDNVLKRGPYSKNNQAIVLKIWDEDVKKIEKLKELHPNETIHLRYLNC